MTDPTPTPGIGEILAADAPQIEQLSLALAAAMGAPTAIVQLIGALLPLVETALENRQGMSISDAQTAQAHLQGTIAKLDAHIAAMSAATP